MTRYLQLIVFFTIISQPLFGQSFTIRNIETKINTSFRGISIVNDKVAWVSGKNGWIGISINEGNNWEFKQVPGFETADFRSIYAFDAKTAIVANTGSPANILLTKNGGKSWKIVYTNTDSSAFFDGIDFWDKQKGIIYGDAINGNMLILKTIDKGNTWSLLPKQNRPTLKKGEFSFAASGTGIRCYGNKNVIISTGGKPSRLFSSVDKGLSWKSINTPIIQNSSSTGIFSFAFINAKKGIIVGGDYLKDVLVSDNAFYTIDGGENWLKPNNSTGGYRECVQYIDNKTIIAVGPTGIDISIDSGINWKGLSDEKSFHVIQKSPKGNLIILAGGNGKIALLKRIN
jgi:photosystem II stability/assembly factor-like uncharacterized protein